MSKDALQGAKARIVTLQRELSVAEEEAIVWAATVEKATLNEQHVRLMLNNAQEHIEDLLKRRAALKRDLYARIFFWRTAAIAAGILSLGFSVATFWGLI